MSTSDDRAYVWAFLPGEAEAVVAGVLFESSSGLGLGFQYGTSYLARADAMALGPDLPLAPFPTPPIPQHRMPSSIRDAMPDSWGRAVVNRAGGVDLGTRLPELRYALGSGSERTGALDFQAHPRTYVSRVGGGSLRRIAADAAVVDEERERGGELERSVRNSLTAAGGSQPKAYVRFEGRQWLAKFTTDYDRQSPLIKAEAAALHLARMAGLDVPDWQLVSIDGDRVALLAERFDRVEATRRQVISGHTIAQHHAPRGGSYPVLMARLRPLTARPGDVGPAMLSRLAFRIAARIDDDHLRNVAAFWDGQHAELTPMFDLSPDLVATPTSLTDIGTGAFAFDLGSLVEAHAHYDVSRSTARDIALHMVDTVRTHRADAADAAMMTSDERRMLFDGMATAALRGTLAR